MSIDPRGASILANQSFTDINGLQKLKGLKPEQQKEAVGEVAKQFESVMLQMMLKSMRQASDALTEGGMFGSNEMMMRRDMLDQQLSLAMTSGRGTGLAELFERQLLQQYFNSDEVQADPEQIQASELRRSTHNQAIQRASASNPVANAVDFIPADLDPEAFDTPQAFVEAVMPYAEKAADKLGVNPELLVAQAALETGWGKSIAGNNLFGVKANNAWQGDRQSIMTHEFEAGNKVNVRDDFRQYASLEDSFTDYASFIQSSQRYATALEADSDEEYIQQLQQSGYATDPNYANKVIRVMSNSVFDRIPEPAATQTIRVGR